MKRYRTLNAIGALVLASAVVAVQAQQPPAAGGQPPAGGAPGRMGGPGRGAGGMAGGMGGDGSRVLIVGENPSIDHRATQGGGMGAPTATTANFWRVTWSPAGPGVACFVIVNDPTPAAQKFVITDNPKLAEYISSKEILERLIPTWNNPPFTVIQGTVTQTNNGNESRVETCRGGNRTVELKWTGGLRPPTYLDPGFARSAGIIMNLFAVNSAQQEIVIDGKRAPGQFASGFMALAETWRTLPTPPQQ